MWFYLFSIGPVIVRVFPQRKQLQIKDRQSCRSQGATHGPAQVFTKTLWSLLHREFRNWIFMKTGWRHLWSVLLKCKGKLSQASTRPKINIKVMSLQNWWVILGDTQNWGWWPVQPAVANPALNGAGGQTQWSPKVPSSLNCFGIQ